MMEPQENNPDKFLDNTEYYKILRGQVEFNDNEVNTRMIWLMISQSFFYSAYAIILNAPEHAKNKVYAELQEVLIWILPLSALAACLLSYFGVIATVINAPKVNHYFNSLNDKPSKKLELPPLITTKSVRFLRNISPVLLPAIFIISWVLLLIIQWMKL